MEMTSSVMRFALATYFMKRGSSRPFQSLDVTYESNVATSCFNDEEDENEDVDSDVVSTHVSNLRQMLESERLQDWSRGIDELREYVAVNDRLGSLVAVLLKMIKRQKEDAVCIVQVIEDMCFESNGEPSEVFDQLTELLFEALSHCCENKEDAGMAIWLLRVVDAVVHGLHQYHEQRYGMASGRQQKVLGHNLEETIAEAIQDCLVNTRAGYGGAATTEG